MKKFLPLFPLPLVLVPNEILPLYIFEPRYRKMIENVGAGDRRFGISYFNPRESFADRPDAGTVGCVAELKEVQAMPDGTSNIWTVGAERYRLIDYVEDAGEPYYVGEVEDYEEDASVLQPLADECAALFRRVVEETHKLNGNIGAPPAVPPHTDALDLSFLLVNAFKPAPDFRYELLEMRSTVERLTRMREFMRRRYAEIEDIAGVRKIAGTNGHSKRK